MTCTFGTSKDASAAPRWQVVEAPGIRVSRRLAPDYGLRRRTQGRVGQGIRRDRLRNCRDRKAYDGADHQRTANAAIEDREHGPSLFLLQQACTCAFLSHFHVTAHRGVADHPRV